MGQHLQWLSSLDVTDLVLLLASTPESPLARA